MSKESLEDTCEHNEVTQFIILFDDLFLNESPYVAYESDMYWPQGIYIDKAVNIEVVGENETQYCGKPYTNSSTIVFFDKKRYGVDYCIAHIDRNRQVLNHVELSRMTAAYAKRKLEQEEKGENNENNGI